MGSETRLLVISYFFPPYPRVGGRRWAKHVKYLTRSGISTFVLTRDFKEQSSSWDEDIKEYKERIYRVSTEQPKRLYFKNKLPVTLSEKLRWKTSLHFWNLKKVFLKGNYTDPSRYTSTLFLDKARQIIHGNKINTVLLSVGPFSFSEVIPALKKEYPELRFIVDYRDKWEDSLSDLNAAQRSFELKKQKNVLEVVDLVLTVNDEITTHITKLVTGKIPVVTIPHCVDEDFFKLAGMPKQDVMNDIHHFIYGGELYNKMDNEIQNFLNFFDLYRAQNRSSADFYLTYPNYEKELLRGGVQISGFLNKQEFQDQLRKADYILLFRPEWSAEAFSSKFFEILCLRRPVLYFGKKGAVSDFLLKHHLGFHIENDNLEAAIKEVTGNLHSNAIPDKTFDLSPFTFESQTKKLVFWLQSSEKKHDRTLNFSET